MEESSMAKVSFLCLISFSIIILSNATDISIDCGSASSYIDAANRTWVGDSDFVATGLKSTFKPSVKTAVYLTTLRYFPTGETNCYSNIPVDKGGKVLVRTLFNYGNYDGNYNAPNFDVVYDGKHRDSVITTTSGIIQSEAIFIPESGNISICFVRTFMKEYPFVSTVEVRRLDNSMYTDLGPTEGFILQRRTAYGRLQELVRSPFDPYDRFWSPTPASTSILTSAAGSINTTGADNRPPEIVLRTAWSEKGMYFYNLRLPFSGVTFYIVLYFSEPLSLGSDQKRSFYVYFDDKQVGQSIIVPPFGAVTQAALRAVVTTKNPYLRFRETPDSNLNPLINALELYVISNNNSGGNRTNSTRGGSPSTGGGGGGGSSTSNGGDSSGSGGAGGKSDSSRKSEEEKNSNLNLPLGITIPSVFVLGTGGWAAWKFCIKPKRNREPKRQVTQHFHYGNEQSIMAGRVVNPTQTSTYR